MNLQTWVGYSIVKHEDVMPYANHRFLMAADGLGGSGSKVHPITKAMSKLSVPDLAALLFESPDDANAAAVDEYQKALMDELLNGSEHTSAFWASRIVGILAKTLATAFPEDQTPNPSDWLNVFQNALIRVAKALEFQVQPSLGQRLLPTTFVAATAIHRETDSTLRVLWAGDSRLYAVSSDGWFLLTQDDEDSSGALTNLLYAETYSGSVLKIHHRDVVLKHPFTVFAVSDGTFDPFDPFDHHGLAYSMSQIVRDASGWESLTPTFQAYFDQIKHDDATIAMMSVGFDDFASFQDFLERQIDPYVRHVKAFQDSQHLLPLLDVDPSSLFDYVIQRIVDKKSLLSKKIVSLYSQDPHNPFFPSELTDALERLRNQIIKDRNDEKRSRLIRQVLEDAKGFRRSTHLELFSDSQDSLALELHRLEREIKSDEAALRSGQQDIARRIQEHERHLKAFVRKTEAVVSTDHPMTDIGAQIAKVGGTERDYVHLWIRLYDLYFTDQPENPYYGYYVESQALAREHSDILQTRQALLDQMTCRLRESDRWISSIADRLDQSDWDESIFTKEYRAYLYGKRLLPLNESFLEGEAFLAAALDSEMTRESVIVSALCNAILDHPESGGFESFFNLTKLQQARWFRLHGEEDKARLRSIRDGIEEDLRQIERLNLPSLES